MTRRSQFLANAPAWILQGEQSFNGLAQPRPVFRGVLCPDKPREGQQHAHSTLSETARTEPVYARQVILIDDQSNVLTIMGTPNNVEIGEGMEWREAYKMIDEANLVLFRQIVESLMVK